MTKPIYSLSGYRLKLLTTRNRVLLVEGPDDKRALSVLLNQVAPPELLAEGSIVVDSAAMIKSPEGQTIGNRDKVEEICESVRGQISDDRFVGFVDREYREFEENPVLVDPLSRHHVAHPLIWSRGHSLENYFFQPEVFQEAFRYVTDPEHVHAALCLFQTVFPSVLETACAIAMAGRDCGFLGRVGHSVHWSCLQFAEGRVKANINTWKRSLIERSGFDDTLADHIVARYAHWHELAAVSSQTTVRWFTHGHVGWATMWHAYAGCVYQVSNHNSAAADRVLMVDNGLRSNICMETWAKLARQELADYPRLVLKALDISPPDDAA